MSHKADWFNGCNSHALATAGCTSDVMQLCMVTASSNLANRRQEHCSVLNSNRSCEIHAWCLPRTSMRCLTPEGTSGVLSPKSCLYISSFLAVNLRTSIGLRDQQNTSWTVCTYQAEHLSLQLSRHLCLLGQTNHVNSEPCNSLFGPRSAVAACHTPVRFSFPLLFSVPS